MNYQTVRDLLFLLPPEVSHYVALRSIDVLHRLHLTYLVTDDIPEHPVEVMGISFKNRVGLAAGLDKDGTCVDGLGALGFGFLEVGTVTPKGQRGNPKPRLFRLKSRQALINRMGFNNAGVDALVERLRHSHFDGVLGINIGKNFDTALTDALNDYEYCMRRVYEYAAYIVVNISSPNTPGLRNLQHEEEMAALLDGLKKAHEELVERYSVRVPLVVKIAPDMEEEQTRQVCRRLLDFEVDGVIVGNTTVSRAGLESEAMAFEGGGLSGAPLLAQSNQVLQLVAEEVKGRMGIIGVGGIMSGDDAATKIALGADLVQIYTGFIFHGPALISECVRATKNF